MSTIVLVGGGGHARVLLDALSLVGATVAGLVDSDPCEATLAQWGVTHLGGEEASLDPAWVGLLAFGELGAGGRRQAAVERLSPRLAGWATIIHPAAAVSRTARIAAGTVVLARAVVQAGARVGAQCIVNTGAVVEHDVVMEDFVQLSPGAIVGGGARIGAGAFVGLGAVIRDHVTIGAGATVGMGSVVVGDVPAGARILGVPGRRA